MKRSVFIIVSLLCAVALWSCQTDNTTDITSGGNVTQLTVSTPETRTALGGKVDGVYPVSWSDGDCIVANGAKSGTATISTTDPSNAIFDFGSVLNYPLKVTYPYTSTSTANSPKVVVPSEQNYVANTFATETSPMCGYAKNIGDKVVMSHLAGVLRFPVKASNEGTALDKIVITSTSGAKLSGEFAVNCTTATMTATENSTNVITYNLPDDFKLSTSAESVFHVVIPAGEIGTCTIEFVETSGGKMTSTWSPSSIKKGIVREFKPITYKRGATGSLEAYASEEDDFFYTFEYYDTVYGFVKDVNGNPISGVAVSDGFSVTTTDAVGYYTLKDVTADCNYIYISVPSEYEIPINEHGQPCFYKKFEYPGKTPQYDFTLTPLPGGKEEKFALFTFGDPQVSSTDKYKRFINEAVPGIKKHYEEVAASGIPCYGITLGDIISNGAAKDSGKYRPYMRDGFSVTSVGLPVFQVMGNHDNTFYNANNPIETDDRNSTFNLKAQREHEDIFGPANYSFNRGDTHIIGMRDIVYTSNTAPSYDVGFLDEQFEWLKQDLALVPKDKNVVLCVHIPLYNHDYHHIQEVLALLNTFKEVHIMSGHTHILHNVYEHKVKGTGYNNVFEHNMGAVCGNWWRSNTCGDGAPCGFGVFIGEGNTFSDWYYTGYHEGMNTRSHQMRLHYGNAVTGAKIEGDNEYGTKGYYAFNYTDEYIVANVYFADSQWTMKVYENDVYSGDMELVDYKRRPLVTDTTMTGDGSYENPFRSTYETSSDMYTAGHLLGVLGLEEGGTGIHSWCYHLYKYQLKNKKAKIKVVAVDRFGNEYTETEITEGTDYSITAAK